MLSDWRLQCIIIVDARASASNSSQGISMWRLFKWWYTECWWLTIVIIIKGPMQLFAKYPWSAQIHSQNVQKWSETIQMLRSFGIFHIGWYHYYHTPNSKSQRFDNFNTVRLRLHLLTTLHNFLYFMHNLCFLITDKILKEQICINTDCRHGKCRIWKRHSYRIFLKVNTWVIFIMILIHTILCQSNSWLVLFKTSIYHKFYLVSLRLA